MPGEQELEALLHEAAAVSGHDAAQATLAAARRELRLLQQRQPLLVYSLGREALARLAWERGLAVRAQQERQVVLQRKMQARCERSFDEALKRRGGGVVAVGQVLAYGADTQDLGVDRAARVLANVTMAGLLPFLAELRHATAAREFVARLFAAQAAADVAAQDGVTDFADADAAAVHGVAVHGAAVREWRAATEALRQRLLAAGGEVAEAEAWWLPQGHDQARIAAAGGSAWVAEVLPMIERGAYVDANGAVFDEAALRAWLRRVQVAIALGSHERDALLLQLRWRDARAWLAYQRRYGGGDFVAVLLGHVQALARRVALVEALGPQPRADFMRWQEVALAAHDSATHGCVNQDNATRDSATHDGTTRESTTRDSTARENTTEDNADCFASQESGGELFAEVAAERGLLPGAGVANYLPGLRHYLREVRATPAVLGGLACAASQRASAWLWQSPVLARLEPVLLALDASYPGDAALLRAAHVAVDVFAAELNRFASGFVALPAAVATPLLLAAGPQAVAEAARRAQAALVLSVLGELVVEYEWSALAVADRAVLAVRGIDADSWALWRRAKREHASAHVAGLSPAAMAESAGADVAMTMAAVRLAALALGSLPVSFAPVSGVNAGASDALARHGEPLTLTAALRLLAGLDLPSSLPWSQAAALPGGGSKAACMAALVAGGMLLGALSLGLGQRLAGAPIEQEVSLPALWAALMVQGGAMGIYIDTLLDLPGARDGDDAPEAARGDAAEALRLVQNIKRGSTLWYGKAAFDHLLLHLVHEMLTPEYLGYMQEKASALFGGPFAWLPGLQSPARDMQGAAP